MANLRELFEEVRKEFQPKAALSVTKLPENQFFKILSMEKKTTIYGDRILVELDHSVDVWLTEFWSKKLDGDSVRRLSREGSWEMAYTGMKRIGQYSRADISVREDLAMTPSLPDKPFANSPNLLGTETSEAAEVVPQSSEQEQQEDVIVLETPPPPPQNTTTRKRVRRGHADQPQQPKRRVEIKSHPIIGSQLAQSPLDPANHPSYEALFAENYE